MIKKVGRMKKSNLVWVLLLFVALLSVCGICLAQEQVTITTYYPAPYGVYQEMSANKFAVDVAGAGTQTEFDNMANGDAHIGRSLIIGASAGGYAYSAGATTADGYLIVKSRVGVATNAPTYPLDVNGNVNVRGTQVRMGNSANHLYGDASNMAIRVSGAFYVQNQAGSALTNIHASNYVIYTNSATTSDPMNVAPYYSVTRFKNSSDTP